MKNQTANVSWGLHPAKNPPLHRLRAFSQRLAKWVKAYWNTPQGCELAASWIQHRKP